MKNGVYSIAVLHVILKKRRGRFSKLNCRHKVLLIVQPRNSISTALGGRGRNRNSASNIRNFMSVCGRKWKKKAFPCSGALLQDANKSAGGH